VRRFVLLLAAGSLWLFLAAIPALADGGPHVASVNSGVTSLTADGCAGCHRAHTAQGQSLLVQADENDLCLSCHDATSTGATTDVVTGVQYVKGTIAGNDKSNDPVLGYLRDGGFEMAHLGSSDGELIRVGYNRALNTVSFRMKVPVETTAEAATSAHLDLDGAGGVVAKDKIWGNGLANASSPVVSMECGSCHNPHGNGQYRILNKLNASDQLVQASAVNIVSVSATTDRFLTSENHNLIVGDIVTISGVTGVAPAFTGQYIVKTIPVGNQFTLAPAPTKTSADISGAAIDVTTSGTGGSVQRYAALVDDAPAPAAGDTRNYTVLQVKGTQGTNSSYMLYESDVLAARATGTFNGVAGNYASTSGDYFHRTVPWNPAVNEPASNCNTANPIAAGTCLSANDAPNGRPATVTTAGSGAVAYNDQISAWCTTCHTRYYSSTNPPRNATDTPSTPQVAKVVVSADPATENITVTAHGYAVGDRVQFTGGPAPLVDGTTYYVVVAATNTFQVSATLDGAPFDITATGAGTVIRTATVNASSWWYPRAGGDTSYKFQHQTTTNRACTTCHVGHGTDAQTTVGSTSFSNDLAYPDGTAATSGYNSRLLKIDNRGTCQACHDPTGTATAGAVYGTNPGANLVP
jgi:predicted CXXCH cytochrome family protein